MTIVLRPVLEHINDPAIERNFNALQAVFQGLPIFIGSGSPNGAVTASPPAIYLNQAGGAGTTLYVKESGSNTNLGWVGK